MKYWHFTSAGRNYTYFQWHIEILDVLHTTNNNCTTSTEILTFLIKWNTFTYISNEILTCWKYCTRPNNNCTKTNEILTCLVRLNTFTHIYNEILTFWFNLRTVRNGIYFQWNIDMVYTFIHISHELLMVLCKTHSRPQRERNFPCPPSRDGPLDPNIGIHIGSLKESMDGPLRPHIRSM